MGKSAIFFADGLEEIEGLTVVDLFRRVALPIDIISISGSREITGAHGIRLGADLCFEEAVLSDYDLLILPGGMPGTLHLRDHAGLAAWLQSADAAGRWIAAICAAPTVLGGLGLLKGRHATCYPGREPELTGAICEKTPVVRDGHIITSRGMGTAIDFACELISLLKDPETAEKLAASIVYRQE